MSMPSNISGASLFNLGRAPHIQVEKTIVFEACEIDFLARRGGGPLSHQAAAGFM